MISLKTLLQFCDNLILSLLLFKALYTKTKKTIQKRKKHIRLRNFLFEYKIDEEILEQISKFEVVAKAVVLDKF